MSAGIWIFSAGFDGRFLQSLMPAGLVGSVMAYGLNFTADISNELLAYVFTKLQRGNRRGSKMWRLSFSLLAGQAIALYFGTVFGWATIANVAPELATWLQWSAAMFPQVTLLFIGIAQALLDIRIEESESQAERAEERKEKRKQAEPVAKGSEPEPQAAEEVAESPAQEPLLPFVCEQCGYRCATQNGLNAHMRVHKADKSNGKAKLERVAATESET